MKLQTKLLTIILSLFFVGCAELEFENNNNPDAARVYSSPADLVNLAGSAYNTWFKATHEYAGAGMMLAVAADNMSCSWGNAAMREQSWEPRQPFDNSPNYGYSYVTKDPYESLYASLYAANTVLQGINSGLDFGGDENLAKAFSKFVQGISLGYVALMYDKAYIVKEDTPAEYLASPTFFTYKEIADAAIVSLDEAIALSSNTFTIPANWMGGFQLTNTEFKQVVNTFAARIIAYTPRNSTENAQVNWAKVKTYADNGITSDLSIQGDGAPWNGATWFNEHLIYLIYPGWARVDMRIVNMMDPAQPARWEDRADFPHPAASVNGAGIDQRLFSDYQYLSSNNFRSERGYYHYSNYRFSRYDNYLGAYDIVLPEIMVAENDMLRAEARVYTGDLQGAADIINAGTRTTRGGLAFVGAVKADLINAIHRERSIELMCTGLGIQYFDMRKNDWLQPGTPLHYPTPASILEVLGETKPFYTFGGADNADGTDTSNGGWF